MEAAFPRAVILWLGVVLQMSAMQASAVSASLSLSPPSEASVIPRATPQFRRYGTVDGLPSSYVYAVVQDPQGAIWFGTKGGLARFDGVDFKVFRHAENDPGSLSSNGIATLMVDRQGRLWAAGLNAGLNRYQPASGSFLHWEHDPDDPSSLSSSRVWAIAQTADGSLWIGTANGLDHMHADGHGFEHVVSPLLGSQPTDFGTVAALHVDSRQRMWIGCGKGVFVREPDGRIWKVGSEEPDQTMDAWRIEGTDDRIRIATTKGLMVVGEDGVARRFGDGIIPATNVMSSVRDARGRLWIATQKGLFLQESEADPVTAVADQPVLYGNLPGTWIWQLMVDREGGLWAALYDGGVAYLAPGWNQFSRFTHIPDDPASLRDSMATTMARGKDGRHVWVGERGGRVDRLDPETGEVEHALSGLHGDVVGLTEDARHRLWVVVQGGLYRLTGKKFERVDPAGQMKSPLEVEPGLDGQMYVRTFGQGLFRIDPDSLVVTRMPMQAGGEKLLWGSQMTLHDGRFWYASDGGMMWLTAGSDRFVPVPGIPAGKSVDAFDYTDDGVWTANADELAHYHFEGDHLVRDHQVDAEDGWPSLNVTDLHVDSSGQVWVFGHDGLWRFDPRNNKFRSFGLQDGLTNGEFSRGFATMPSGYIYAATLGGVVAFNPDRISQQRSVPQLAITQAQVRRHGVAQLLPVDRDVLEVGWKDSQLQIQARVFSYFNPIANHYRFRLHGLDNDWIDGGNRGARDFSGLAAGKYRLEVMAAGADGIWTHLPTPLRIDVQAPPWLRWWAWLIYAALVILLAWILLLAWRRRLAQRHQIQLAQQHRRLAEQASAAKTQFLATLSHEIRTPMTGVMGMAELLQNSSLDPQQRDYTETMQRSGRMLLKLLNDALDLARIEAGKMDLDEAPFDPCLLLEEVAQLERGLAISRGLRLRLEVADDLPTRVMGDEMRIKQVLLNLVSNALKFTERGKVTLRGSRAGDDLLFSVSDTGPGIPEASQARLFQRFEQEDSPQRLTGSGLGLAICRELVSMMHGSIELESQLGRGSTFHVRLPLHEPASDAASVELAAAMQGQTLRLLLVEDDAIVAAVIVGLLERQGHAVVHVVHGLAALAELNQAAFDVILLDLDLPAVDGFQVARLIRQGEAGHCRVPIIAVTARSSQDDEAQARAAGMDGFLRKPLTGEQLHAALAQVLEGTQAQATPAPDHG